MTEPPFLSIVVATRNSRGYLEGLARSLAEQSNGGFEVLIADGGSTDGTQEVINRIRNLAWSISEPDAGIYDAWNKALPRAKGTWVTFLGADDQFADPGVVERLRNGLRGCDEPVGLAYGRLTHVARGTGATIETVGQPWELARLMLPDRMPIAHCGCLMRTTLACRDGGFDSTFRIIGDFDKILGLHRRGALDRVVFLPTPIVHARVGGISASLANRRQMFAETLRMRHKHGLRLWSPSIIAWAARLHALLLFRSICGDRLAARLADTYRRALGKPASWSA